MYRKSCSHFSAPFVTDREYGALWRPKPERRALPHPFKFASRARSENRVRYGHRQLANRPTRDDIPQGGFRNFSQPHRAFQLAHTMTDEDERELESELARLQQEHRDLDAAIDALHQSPAPDLLRLQRLKKRKLQLRDRIAFIEDQITPDIIA
jgi:hypothetical protein